MKNTLSLIILFSVLAVANAQTNSDLRIAYRYANSGECEKAIELFERFEKKLSIHSYFKSYFQCLLKSQDYDKAISLAKETSQAYPQQIKYLAYLGIAHKANNNTYKAEKEFKKSIHGLRPQKTNDVTVLSSIFSSYGEYEWMIKTFEKGQELNPNFEFGFMLATSLGNLGQTEQMIVTYLDLIEKNASNLNTAKIRLQKSLGRTKSAEDNYKLLKNKLLPRVQKTNNTALTELLVWLFIQSDEYEAAYIYTKALDKRLKEDGNRMYDLAYIAYENQSLEDAIKCYQYLIKQGQSNPFYKDAKISEVIVSGEMLTKSNYTTTELSDLEKKYQSTIDEFGVSKDLVYLIKDYAQLKAFYQYDYDGAISLLQECIDLLVESPIQAECKLMLGDIYLITNKEWDAIIQYSQVEKAFKENPIGHEAKYRRAKVSYFQGQFSWAQAQLDVLKGSTSKLIANNAMKLSLLITDNMGLDTSALAMQMYAKADMLEFQNKFEESISLLDSMLSIFSGHSLTDEIIFKKAEIQLKKKEYKLAADLFEAIAKDFAFDILADDALFQCASLLENQLDNKEKAKELYEKIILDYSDSIYTTEARKRFRKLRKELTI